MLSVANLGLTFTAAARIYIRTSTTSKTKSKIDCSLLLDIVVRESTSILELLSCKNEILFVRGDTCFCIDFCFDALNGISGLGIDRDSLARQSLDKKLNPTSFTSRAPLGSTAFDRRASMDDNQIQHEKGIAQGEANGSRWRGKHTNKCSNKAILLILLVRHLGVGEVIAAFEVSALCFGLGNPRLSSRVLHLSGVVASLLATEEEEEDQQSCSDSDSEYQTSIDEILVTGSVNVGGDNLLFVKAKEG
jgi:hypothetical protein